MFMLFILLAAAGTLFTPPATAQNIQNVNVSAAADALAPVSFDHGDQNKLGVRSAEVLLYGSIDHLFDGMVNIATHEEDGSYPVELHEAYISSSKLIPRSRFRAGKFFLNVGRLNSFHQHDWPFVSAPRSHREFFTPDQVSELVHAESAIDTGLEYSWLVPLSSTFLEITAGVTNGRCFGHCDGEAGRPPYPVHYLHPTTFVDLGTGRGLLIGATYLGRKDAAHTETRLAGFDLTYKSRNGKTLTWLVQSEAYYQGQKPAEGNWEEKAGGYAFVQYGWDERWSVGLRGDGFTQLHRREASTDETIGNLTYAFVPQLTYSPSEFSRFRLAYVQEVTQAEHQGEQRERMIQLQYTFFLGAHPAHDF